jgi:hypothetical protein
MLDAILICAALISTGVAVLLFFRPQIIDWLDENTNLRTARFYERIGIGVKWKYREANLRVLRVGVPSFLLFWGVCVLIFVATR